MMYTMLYACLETRLLSAVMVQPCSCPSCGCGLVPTGGLGYGPIRLARGLNELNKLNSVHMALSIIRVVIRSLQTAYTIMGKMNNAPPPFRVQFYTEIQSWPQTIGISSFMTERYVIWSSESRS